MNDEIFRKIFGLIAFIGIVALWTLLWYMVGFYNGKMLRRKNSALAAKKNTDYLQDLG